MRTSSCRPYYSRLCDDHHPGLSIIVCQLSFQYDDHDAGGTSLCSQESFEMSIFLSPGVLRPGLHAWSPGQLSCDLRCPSLLQNAHGDEKLFLALNSC